MSFGRFLMLVSLGIVAAGASSSCGDSASGAEGTTDLVARCEQLGRTCGDAERHAEEIAAECAQSAEEHAALGCAAEAIAAYDCFEADLCGKDDPIWALDDLRVLSERHEACTAERETLRACAEPLTR